MIEIDITDDQKQRAKELYEFNVLKGSVTEGKGNEVGALGEVIVWDQFKKITKYVGSYDYDMIIRGKKVDVKTKLQNFEPKPYHRANIFAYNIRQKCDYYCFVAILSDLSKGWIIGWKEKDKFFEEAIFKKKGEVDNVGTNEGWVFKGDCYCLNNDQLDNKVKERSTSIN
jgi:hypothetical protein